MTVMLPHDFAKRCLFTVLRTGFRLLPLPQATRDRLRQHFLASHSHWVPGGPRGQVTAAGSYEPQPRTRAAPRAIGHVPRRSGPLPKPLPATVVAFYLPQFHPIAENDAWWGEGFTEWHNVTRALPQFEGHAQPRLPDTLGFYDLRLPSAMRKQMQLAREYGVGAFCSYFYWFAGKRLLEQPLQQWLSDPTLELPLCLCWANENWSRRWNGHADDVLIAQQHSAADDLAFIAHVADYLRDPRYLRVEGHPLLLVYRPGLLPDPRATATRWRQWCRQHDIGEIRLAYVQSFDRMDPATIGFDAAVEFPPNNMTLKPITARQRLLNPAFRGDVLDWRELAQAAMAQPDPSYPCYPAVNPGWDNEPRRSGAGRVLTHASPRGYGQWLERATKAACRRFPTQPLVFVNAWNEWAEGAVLEPDMRFGYAWLEATRDALARAGDLARKPDRRPCAVIHAWYPDTLGEIVDNLRATGLDWRVEITTAVERADAVREVVERLDLAAAIHVAENRGRDILPFLRLAGSLLDEGVDCVLKLHTKRSVHRADGDSWRRELLAHLLAPARAQRIVQAFQDQSSLGLVYPEGHLQPLSYYWGANRDRVTALAARLGFAALDEQHDRFVAGSMFWVQPQALRPLLDGQLDEGEFEAEQGQVDGTMAHALERLVWLAVRAAGFREDSAAGVCGEPPALGGVYTYAQRG